MEAEIGVTYWLIAAADQKRRIRIGIKRHGGLYCKACEMSLLKEGEESCRFAGKVHFDACPGCEKKASDVSECCSFDWFIAPHRLHQRNVQKMTIEDSFGERYTPAQFLSTVIGSTCPVQLYDKIEK